MNTWFWQNHFYSYRLWCWLVRRSCLRAPREWYKPTMLFLKRWRTLEGTLSQNLTFLIRFKLSFSKFYILGSNCHWNHLLRLLRLDLFINRPILITPDENSPKSKIILLLFSYFFELLKFNFRKPVYKPWANQEEYWETWTREKSMLVLSFLHINRQFSVST